MAKIMVLLGKTWLIKINFNNKINNFKNVFKNVYLIVGEEVKSRSCLHGRKRVSSYTNGAEWTWIYSRSANWVEHRPSWIISLVGTGSQRHHQGEQHEGHGLEQRPGYGAPSALQEEEERNLVDSTLGLYYCSFWIVVVLYC